MEPLPLNTSAFRINDTVCREVDAALAIGHDAASNWTRGIDNQDVLTIEVITLSAAVCASLVALEFGERVLRQ